MSVLAHSSVTPRHPLSPFSRCQFASLHLSVHPETHGSPKPANLWHRLTRKMKVSGWYHGLVGGAPKLPADGNVTYSTPSPYSPNFLGPCNQPSATGLFRVVRSSAEIHGGCCSLPEELDRALGCVFVFPLPSACLWLRATVRPGRTCLPVRIAASR